MAFAIDSIDGCISKTKCIASQLPTKKGKLTDRCALHLDEVLKFKGMCCAGRETFKILVHTQCCGNNGGLKQLYAAIILLSRFNHKTQNWYAIITYS